MAPNQIYTDRTMDVPVAVTGCATETTMHACVQLGVGRDHFVVIDGIQVITLGHGIQNDPVASHDYFGTDKVLDDLAQLASSDETGHIVYKGAFVRRQDTLMHDVIGMAVL
jgi:hypothetical protein